MEKQERAFTAWLNEVLVPAEPCGEDPSAGALAAKRLAAQMRGLLWRIYSADEELIGVAMRTEARINGGFLKLRDEVLQTKA